MLFLLRICGEFVHFGRLVRVDIAGCNVYIFAFLFRLLVAHSGVAVPLNLTYG